MIGMLVDVVIPCFNDGATIVKIIQSIQRSTFVNRIFVVDDGSNIKTKEILSNIDHIELIEHQHNLGKSKALLTGFRQSKTEKIVFIDSDLLGFSTYDFNQLVEASENCDMVLGFRKRGMPLSRLSGFSLAYTGERVLSRQTINRNLQIFDVDGYLIEPALNKSLFGKVKIKAVDLKGTSQVFRVKKVGLKGLWADIKLRLDYLKYLGIGDFCFQLKFARQLSRCKAKK